MPEGRADAASALARAYLYSDLAPEVRAEAELGLTAVLDDPSALVRRALAEALASAADAPRHIVLALACDQSEVARVVLGALAGARPTPNSSIARGRRRRGANRPGARVRASAPASPRRSPKSANATRFSRWPTISRPICPPGALWRIFERFGEDAEAREALLSRAWLPPALRNELAAATARALADFAARCDWLSPQRAERIAREAREQATVTILRGTEGEELAEFVRRMRAGGTLTVAVLMRALLCGDRGFFIQALVEISGVPERRVAAFAHSPAGHGFAALYGKARLPPAFLPAFRAALTGIEASKLARGDRVSRVLAERVIEACGASGGPGLAPIQSLLWRLAAEAAREDAREFTEDSARMVPPRWIVSRLDAPNYQPLLIEAVAAALEDFEAPPVAAPCEPVDPASEEDFAPPVQLPEDAGSTGSHSATGGASKSSSAAAAASINRGWSSAHRAATIHRGESPATESFANSRASSRAASAG